MLKRLGGIIGCKDKKTSSWHLNGFPDGSNIGSTEQYRGETHRYTALTLLLIAMQGHQTKQNKSLYYIPLVIIIVPSHLITVKAYQV